MCKTCAHTKVCKDKSEYQAAFSELQQPRIATFKAKLICENYDEAQDNPLGILKMRYNFEQLHKAQMEAMLKCKELYEKSPYFKQPIEKWKYVYGAGRSEPPTGIRFKQGGSL